MRHQKGSVLSALALTAALAFTSIAGAQELALIGGDNPAVPSSFTLNFGEPGGVASARIAFTDIELAVDADSGAARFVRYYQEVDPLILPGGFSTGNLIIEIVDGSSAGTFDASIGQFDTEEFYAIHFEGDLSAFGLESPVFLPSSSTGRVALDTETGGRISLDWTGDGELMNPSDPSTPLNFSYTCSVNATFEPTPVTMVRLALIPDVENLLLPLGTERSLTVKLFGVVDELMAGTASGALRRLNAFNHSLNAVAGRRVAEEDATRLLDLSDGISTMIIDAVGTTSAAGIGNAKGSRPGRR